MREIKAKRANQAKDRRWLENHQRSVQLELSTLDLNGKRMGKEEESEEGEVWGAVVKEKEEE